MKIYQLHEIGGEWEDRYDYIIGSYLRKERAEEEKTKAETEEKKLVEHSKRCNRCPFLEVNHDELYDLLLEFPDYCEEIELEDADYGMSCLSYYSHWYKSTFYIKEVEVEE